MNSDLAKFRNCKLKVALLGGSFDPAHEGHLKISEIALKLLNFDYVWWIVAKQNPFKAQYENDFAQRLSCAKKRASKNPRIFVSDFEKNVRENSTFYVIEALQELFSEISFSWLIGADNLPDFHRWFKHDQIISRLPMIIFDRENFAFKSLSSKTLMMYNDHINFTLGDFKAKNLSPDLHFLKISKIKISSTEIRKINNEHPGNE